MPVLIEERMSTANENKNSIGLISMNRRHSNRNVAKPELSWKDKFLNIVHSEGSLGQQKPKICISTTQLYSQIESEGLLLTDQNPLNDKITLKKRWNLSKLFREFWRINGIYQICAIFSATPSGTYSSDDRFSGVPTRARYWDYHAGVHSTPLRARFPTLYLGGSHPIPCRFASRTLRFLWGQSLVRFGCLG